MSGARSAFVSLTMLTVCCLLLWVAPSAALDQAPAEDEKKQAANAEGEINLVGTWKLVSAKYGGQENELPRIATTLKHITPTHYTWLTYGEDGTVTRGAGGTYTLKGDEFTQMGIYDVEPRKLLKGENTYKCKVEGDKWFHTGKLANRLTIDEVWERVTTSIAEKPRD